MRVSTIRACARRWRAPKKAPSTPTSAAASSSSVWHAPGGGRSGGYRTLIAYQTTQRSVFRYGFAKSERDNINARKLAELKILARQFISLTDAEIAGLLDTNDLKEFDYEPEED